MIDGPGHAHHRAFPYQDCHLPNLAPAIKTMSSTPSALPLSVSPSKKRKCSSGTKSDSKLVSLFCWIL